MIFLVAEDEETDFLLLERALFKSGAAITVRRVRNGVEAMQYLKGEGPFVDRSRFPMPDVVMLDLKMPEATGLDVLEWLQQNPAFRVIPSIVMSASARPEDVQQAYLLGANTYFVKPADFRTLVDLCRQIGAYWGYGVKTTTAGPAHARADP